MARDSATCKTAVKIAAASAIMTATVVRRTARRDQRGHRQLRIYGVTVTTADAPLPTPVALAAFAVIWYRPVAVGVPAVINGVLYVVAVLAAIVTVSDVAA